ncbi:MAG: NAD(+) kinase [Gammaproteobacteria bacterium]|nr:NAD(+) kinase [Gammaproteobacteria bacterium]
MSTAFNTIGLIGKHGDTVPQDALLELRHYLLERGCRVYMEQATGELCKECETPTAPLNQLGDLCDLMIVVGGDGTLLHTARAMAEKDVPLLGINLGRLGFLADISPDEMLPVLDQIFAGHYREENRFLLQTEIDGQIKKALNDVVIHKWNIARMIEFETYIDGQFVDSQRSDGLIISTPTGSTAYALSGGGPLLQPDLNAVVMVPICPHTLSNRPMVINGDSEIEIRVCAHTSSEHLRITCDGQSSLPLEGHSIKIKKYGYQARLIHPEGHDHFHILRAKLGWGGHPA